MRTFSILIVEDLPLLRKQMRELLREALLGTEIETAESVSEAIGVIDTTRANGLMYDLAILDFKLPQGQGDNDEVDESVCHHLMTEMPRTIVGHITGWPADPRIAEHVSRMHPTDRAKGFFLEKGIESFGKELVRMARSTLFGADVEQRIRSLFPVLSSAPHPEGAGSRSANPRPNGSVSNRIMDLCLDIRTCWGFLGPYTRELVDDFFLVEKTADGRGVTVVPR